MLQLRPNCECCDRDLPPRSRDALICTFECTFCSDCAEARFAGTCPNCGGELVRRPVGVVVLPDLAAIFRSFVGGESAANHPATLH